jgi:hypothetical protein
MEVRDGMVYMDDEELGVFCESARIKGAQSPITIGQYNHLLEQSALFWESIGEAECNIMAMLARSSKITSGEIAAEARSKLYEIIGINS